MRQKEQAKFIRHLVTS